MVSTRIGGVEGGGWGRSELGERKHLGVEEGVVLVCVLFQAEGVFFQAEDCIRVRHR